jgi:phosphoribosylformimino-5-aminoimidazole carboxamide ribotide isomerase
MDIIPAIDIIDGKCVRLTQGDYNQKKIYNEDPLEVALEFEGAGLTRLHLVDLDGAKAGAVKNWKVLEKLASKTSLKIDFGGGIKTDKDLRIILDSGAAYAAIGSIAVKKPALLLEWAKQHGSDKFLIGADVRNEKLAISGWLEETSVWVFDFIRDFTANGFTQFFCTDVSKDGLLEGPSTDLYKRLIDENPGIYFIASGGVSNMKDVQELAEAGCNGAIIGKAIYENRITLKELMQFQLRSGISK